MKKNFFLKDKNYFIFFIFFSFQTEIKFFSLTEITKKNDSRGLCLLCYVIGLLIKTKIISYFNSEYNH